MAMSLLLRNSLKLQVCPLSNFAKYSCASISRNPLSISPLCGQNEVSSKRLSVVNPYLNTPMRTIITSAPTLSAHGNHTAVWKAERLLSIIMLGVLPAGICCPHPVLDSMIAVTVVMHSYWGLEACVVDYVRPIIFGDIIPQVAKGLLALISMVTLAGLLYFNHNDVGIGSAIRSLWCIKGFDTWVPPAAPKKEPVLPVPQE